MSGVGAAQQAAATAAEADRNGVMLQYFYWDLPRDGPDGGLWRQLTARAAELAAAGFTSLWLPPPVKGASGDRDVGYGVGAAGAGGGRWWGVKRVGEGREPMEVCG